MKALTLTQPWATLAAIREKRLETRGWRTSYRGPLVKWAQLLEVLGLEATSDRWRVDAAIRELRTEKAGAPEAQALRSVVDSLRRIVASNEQLVKEATAQ